MSARELPHVDLVAYLLGSLEDDERTGVERHIDGCALCSAEAVQLGPAASLLGRAAPPVSLSRPISSGARSLRWRGPRARRMPSRTARSTRRAPASSGPRHRHRSPPLARAGAWPGGAPPWPRAWPRLWPPRCSPARSSAATTCPARPSSMPRSPAAGGQTASAVVQKTGIGRVIEFRTDELPILPEGRVLRALVRRAARSPGESRADLRRDVPSRRGRPLERALRRRGGPRQVSAARGHGRARRRRSRPVGAGHSPFDRQTLTQSC